jgi:glutathione S-transferase
VPDIKLWYAPGACSLATHVLLYEVRVPFDAVEISLAKGAHLTGEFAQVNPKKRVPVLSLDGEVITEVPAVATAVASLAPERHLMGRTALDRTRVHEWMNWLSGTLHGQGFAGLWRPQRFSDDPETFGSIAAKGKRTIIECFGFIESRLSGLHPVKDDFTAVDPYLLVFYRWGNGIGLDMPATYPRYTTFAQELVRRGSAAAALAAEGLSDRALADQVPRMDTVPRIAQPAKENAS